MVWFFRDQIALKALTLGGHSSSMLTIYISTRGGELNCHRHPSNGGRIVLGSDFPVEGINPLLGFYAAVTRLDVNGKSPHGSGGWYVLLRE